MSQEPHARDRLNAEVVALIRQHTGTEQQDIDIMGKRFIVLPEVFYSPVLQHILEALAHSPLKIVAEELARRGPTTALDILEIGPGLGHFAVCAASLGPHITVTAVDISPAAVENVTINATLHGVADRVRCAVGDVYNATVTDGKTFDMIVWDPPFSKGDPVLAASTALERAVWDPDYAGLRQYMARAREFLKPAGRLLLAWNNFFGDGAWLEEIATRHGWQLKTYGIAHFPVGRAYLTFLSYELLAHEPGLTGAASGAALRL